MELPRFFSDQTNDESPPRQRSAPTELSAEELAEINHLLDEQAGRRRHASPSGVIRIMVDGVERARLNPVEQSSISFSIEEDAEVFEVKALDQHGDLLLATHLLTSFGKEALVTSIRLEGGQELSLSITRRQGAANGEADLFVTFGYRETNPWRAARLWWQGLSLRFAPEQDSGGLWAGTRISRYILAGIVLVVCLTGYLAYVRLRSRQTSEPVQTSSVQTTPVREDAVSPVAEATKSPNTEAVPQPTRRAKNDRTSKANVSAPSPDAPAQDREEDVAEDATRSGSVVPNLTLREVKKVYVAIRGDTSNELRNNLIASLNSSRMVAATGAEEGDAALKIVLSQTGPQIEASAQLVNARGAVLWRGAGRYSGDVTKVVSEIVKDLLSEIRLARGR